MSSTHNAMQLKFDVRCSRVKSISFHPELPWVLCGLHCGTVKILDYRMKSTVDQFVEHEGAVRGAHFHPTQPLFVTGGDDTKIKVWNFKLRRCLFTLSGHMDYIRSTEFHREQPWVLSASDDQTVRIWNWQSRSCLSTLTGHNHYVMSAQFHPTEDLIATSSLDLTIRVWDISGLRNRRQESGGVSLPHDLFGSNDVVVKFILEGHTKAVNYAAFHPTKPMIVSSSDDRTVRLWKLEDTRTYEIEQLCGHLNNVSCVLFFKESIVTCSEDRTIRVWDASARATTHMYRREGDRFWMLAVHERGNLIAAGHDEGLLIFKLERERPAWTVQNDVLYWVRDRSLRSYAFSSGQEHSVAPMRRHATPPVALSCNPADHTMIASYDIDGGMIEYFTAQSSAIGRSPDADVRKLFYASAVFFAANKWAALDKSGQLLLRNTQDPADGTSKVLPPVHGSNRIFPAWSGHVLCRSPTAVYIFQMAQKATIAELTVADVKYVVWDAEAQKVALLSKRAIVIATRKLKTIAIIQEGASAIKSAAFDEQRDVLFYTTLHHLKYCTLRNGETGIVQSLPCAVYLVRARSDTLWWISRESKVEQRTVSSPEISFKLALQQERYRDVLGMIQSRKLMGRALVAYLQKNNHPDIAMHFSSDPWTRFNLALQSGIVDVAKSTALELNRPDAWCALAEKATLLGDVQLAQLANAKVRNDSGLCHQLLLTGAITSMRQVAQQSGNLSLKVHTAVVTRDPVAHAAALVEGGHLPLAYATAMSHGLGDLAQEVLSQMSPEAAAKCADIPLREAEATPAVEAVNENWPMLPVQESMFQRMLREPGLLDMEVEKGDVNAAWGDDNDLDFADVDEPAVDSPAEPEGPRGDWDDDLDIDVPLPSSSKVETIVPREGEPLGRQWVEMTQLVPFHVAAGSFQTAFELLQRQIALKDRAPLQTAFMQCWCSCNANIPSWGALPAQPFSLAAPPGGVDLDLRHVPRLPDNLPSLTERVRLGYQAVTEARFVDARKIFHGVLMHVVVSSAKDRKQHTELVDIVAVAREYVAALNVELARKESTDPKRAVELSIYFAHFKLQPSHLVLALSQAMTQAFKAKCLKTAATIARRLSELDAGPDRLERARKVIQVAEQQNTDALSLAYNDRNPFQLCAATLVPMYRGTVDVIRCVYCGAVAHPDHRGAKCPVCLISTLGAEGTGLMAF